MKHILSILVTTLGMAASVHAQTTGGVTMSTDPARAAAVEQHAQQIKMSQSPQVHAPAAKSHHASSHSHHAKPKHASAKQPAAK